MRLSQSRLDAVLREAAEKRAVPGVVAMAATARGKLYEGAFGRRRLDPASGDRETAMTLDTVFRIASMTKAVTAVAAMQLVEAGKLALDAPVPAIAPALAAPQVLDGFDRDGRPLLRPARRKVTLKHLLTHTAGFGYEPWSPPLARYVAASGAPSISTGKRAALDLPLLFDPGERWEYGINIDWVGRVVEELSGQPLDVYFRDHIFAPLGMRDTAFRPSPEQRLRQATLHQRMPGGALVPQPLEPLAVPEFWSGGGGLYSTADDYLVFLQMLLNGGSFAGARILTPETVTLMGENHIGALPAGLMRSAAPELSNDVAFFPAERARWGLGYLLTLDPGPNGRAAGSLTWAGLFNTYYWLDPTRAVAGLILTQILPFADAEVVALYGAFERAVYAALAA